MAEVGQVLAGRYRIVELLGQGGMATIYRGHDSQLGRDVAIKVLRSEYGRDPAFVARFRQEAQSAAVLSHPNVVNVFDFGMEAGDPFIVMELIDGGDLAGMIAQGPLEPLAAARIAQQIFEALDTAHGRGIVHRDIKPTNVLMTTSGRVKVADFGIARAFSEAQLTMPGTTLGSVHYFSPEQARGEIVTSASDVYSAGLVLFEMLTGRRAWTGDSAGAVAVARLTGDPPMPSSVTPGIPQVLDVAVERALSRAPVDRPTASDMAALLGRYIVNPDGAAASFDSTGAAAGAGAGIATGATVGQGQITSPGSPVPLGSGTGSVGAAFDTNSAGYYSTPPRYESTADQYGGGPAYGTVRGGASPRRGRYVEEEPEQESAGTWGWIAAVLGVLVLFAGGLLLFLLLSGGRAATPSPSGLSPLVDVPSFVGMPLDEAQALANQLGLLMTVGAFQVAEVPEDTIVTQDPAAGGQVAPGSLITVTVASPTITVLVPDVRLRTEADLFALLAQAELVPGLRSEAYDPEVPATLLVRTNPRAGVEVVRGTAIDYVVSLGAAPTPSPTPPITPTPPPTPTPTPTPTPPPTPTPTPPPTPTPIVCPTPDPMNSPPPEDPCVTVGNYVLSQDLGIAKTQIVEAGLTVGTVVPADASDDWIVCVQDPLAGSHWPPGTAVNLLVNDPADGC